MRVQHVRNLMQIGHQKSDKIASLKYRKIPIITSGLIFVQKPFYALILGGAYFWRGLLSEGRWVGLDNKNSLKHYDNSLKQLKTARTNSPWAYIREGLL